MGANNPYRLTIIAALVVLVLSVGIVTVVGGNGNTAMYLGLVATVAIPALLTLFKQEQTSSTVTALHQENNAKIAEQADSLQKLTDVAQKLQATTSETNQQVAQVQASVSNLPIDANR